MTNLQKIKKFSYNLFYGSLNILYTIMLILKIWVSIPSMFLWIRFKDKGIGACYEIVGERGIKWTAMMIINGHPPKNHQCGDDLMKIRNNFYCNVCGSLKFKKHSPSEILYELRGDIRYFSDGVEYSEEDWNEIIETISNLRIRIMNFEDQEFINHKLNRLLIIVLSSTTVYYFLMYYFG